MFYNIIHWILAIHVSIFGQKRNNVWTFGDSTGLNFNANPVTPIRTHASLNSVDPNHPFYMSSICDKNGSLMFYTDGQTFWNRDNFVLPKYSTFWPWFADVIPLVAPYVENDSLYYVFGVEGEKDDGPNPNSHKLIYFSTKMYAAGDIEEVVYPRPSNNLFTTMLLSDASHVIAGTGHCNQVDTWIIGIHLAYLMHF
ncbi:hypothetical protein BH20BAC1_BH20BAC1_20780 [soil metagenome]